MLPYAIGPDEGKQVVMGIPESGYFSHGRTHLLSENEKSSMTFEATMKLPNSILKNLQKLDYLKCDIEGYENVAIPLFQDIIDHFRPIMQIEVASENIEFMMSYLSDKDFKAVEIKKGEVCQLLPGKTPEGDIIFIPQEKLSLLEEITKV